MSEFMNSKWVGDIAAMHTKFGVNKVLRQLDRDKLEAFLKFRIDFLQEELDEMRKAVVDRQTGKIDATTAADDTVDALIDLCVVAIGTLNAFDVNADEAWNRVHRANMTKEVGIKESRPNPLGLPDLIKPEGWTAPTHADNIGMLNKVFE
jgi:predicted HAD superfamily Cof-like phosphohydrolase